MNNLFNVVLNKRCPKCREIKSFGEFYKQRSRLDGLQTNCKSCVRQYYLKNRKEYYKKYREDNKEYLKIISQELIKEGEIPPKRFVELSKPYCSLSVKSSSETIHTEFSNLFQKFVDEEEE